MPHMQAIKPDVPPGLLQPPDATPPQLLLLPQPPHQPAVPALHVAAPLAADALSESHRSAALLSRLKDRHTLHMMRHSKHVEILI
jgi:hypothetical protein